MCPQSALTRWQPLTGRGQTDVLQDRPHPNPTPSSARGSPANPGGCPGSLGEGSPLGGQTIGQIGNHQPAFCWQDLPFLKSLLCCSSA